MISRVYTQKVDCHEKKWYNIYIRKRENMKKVKKISFERGQRVTRTLGYGGVGTVVGQCNSTHAWVKWDATPTSPTCRQKHRARWLKKV